MKSQLLLEEMTRGDATNAADANSLLVWPMGAIEQHGPHLPVGTDTFIIEHLAREAAKDAKKEIPIVVAPTLPFGSSDHHLPFGGTMSLSTQLFYQTVMEIAESLIKSKFKRMYLVNSHGGNHELLQLVARDLALKHDVSIASASYWTVAWNELTDMDAHVNRRLPGHAGSFETSVILALKPKLVKEPLPSRESVESTDPRGFGRPVRAEHSGSWLKINGYSDSPKNADVENGNKWINTTVKALSKSMIKFHKESNI